MKKAVIILVAMLLCLSVLLPACGSDRMQWSEPPAMTIDKNKQYTAVISTDMGDITVELFASEAPVTVNNFIFLARQGFYDGLKFHRVASGFCIQTGDPLGTGTGGPGYEFADEPVTRDYTIGTVAMANAGPDTNGSQFFICLSNLTIPKDYTIFGQVTTDSMAVVRKIAAVKTKYNPSLREYSTPVEDVYMNKVTIK